MFIAQFEGVCGIGYSLDSAMEDLHDNLSNFDINLEDDNDVTFYEGEIIAVKKTWVIQ